jgi:excisionase family DNA binding protein
VYTPPYTFDYLYSDFSLYCIRSKSNAKTYMNQHFIEGQLEEIKAYITKQGVSQREILTLAEAAIYAGISKSLLYKLTSKRLLPFYKPGDAKLIFFKRAELDAWLLTNRKPTISEMTLFAPKKKNGND